MHHNTQRYTCTVQHDIFHLHRVYISLDLPMHNNYVILDERLAHSNFICQFCAA